MKTWIKYNGLTKSEIANINEFVNRDVKHSKIKTMEFKLDDNGAIRKKDYEGNFVICAFLETANWHEISRIKYDELNAYLKNIAA
jgi:hypothetical protein